MTPGRRLALVFVCAVSLLLVASLFPAADPRIETPGAGEGDAPETADWETVTEPDERTNEAAETGREPGEEHVDELTPEVEGDLVPGNTVEAGVDGVELEMTAYDSATMLVNGDEVGVARFTQTVSFDVPDAEEVNVTVAETGDRKVFPVETDVGITVSGDRYPTGVVELNAEVGEYNVSGADVFLDGEAVATTDARGEAGIQLRETAGESKLRVERDRLAGNYSLEVAEPDVSFVSPVVFPGTPAQVQVTAGGQPVENATVALDGGSETTTGSGGTTWVRLPVSDEVTATATLGAEEARTTISDLYLRTALVALVVPGLAIGGVWTYLKFFPKRRRGAVPVEALFLSLGAVLGSFAALLAAVGRLRLPSPSLPRFRPGFPSFSLPGLPSFSLPSLGGLFPSIANSGGSGRVTSSIAGLVGSRGSDGKPHERGSPDGTDAEGVGDGDEPLPSRDQELREAWHAFLDHAGVQDRETRTPGEASRYAMAAGYPARSVRRLLSLFRDVEYGGDEPTAEDVTDARRELGTLLDHEPGEDDT